MKLYFFIGVLILVTFACQNQYKVFDQNIEPSRNIVSKTPETKSDSDEIVESFSDSSTIGLPNKNKIELSKIKESEGNLVVIKFYSLEANSNWKLKQKFEFEKTAETCCDPELADFNGDGLKDFTYHSVDAGNGANDNRKLFLYDKKKNALLYIKNSENYPNLQYNKKLNCLDAWLISGGVATVFLRIDGDILKEFASVENRDNSRTISIFDKNGKKKILRKEKITQDDFYTRYANFNPPE